MKETLRKEKLGKPSIPLGRLVPWGALVSRVTRPLFKKGGVGLGSIIMDWDQIVGPRYSQYSQPEKLTFSGMGRHQGILKVRVHGPAALSLQYEEPLILERINRYFGYEAVKKMILFQGPLPSRQKRALPQSSRARDCQKEAVLLAYLERGESMEELDLKKALEGLAYDLSFLQEEVKKV